MMTTDSTSSGYRRAFSTGSAALLTAAVASTLLIISTPGTAHAAPGSEGCPTAEVVMLTGTFETDSAADPSVATGLLKQVTDPLVQQFGSSIKVTYPAYEASAFNKGKTYGTSKATGIAAAAKVMQTRAAQCANTVFALGGYSQGADVAGDLTWLIGHDKGPIPAEKLIAVGLVADPRQSPNGDNTLVGPPVDGVGIAGARPGGFGKTAAVTRSYCAPDDLYCSTNSNKDGLLAGLGRVLSQPPTASGPQQSDGSQPNTAALQNALVSDYSKVDLPGLAGNVDTLQKQLQSGSPDLASVGQAASDIANTLVPVADTTKWVTQNPAVEQSLQTADASTPEFAAGKIVETVKGIDVAGVLKAADTIAKTVQGATGTAQVPQLQASVDTLTNQVSPLTSTPADGLSVAANALSIIKPSVLIDQVTHIGTNAFALANNIPAVADIFTTRIPQIVLDPALDPMAKVKAVHAEFDRINVLFEPLVKLAAGLDYKTAASLIAMIPDPSGTAQIVSMIVGLVGNLDIIGLANSAGELQKQLWHAIETGDVIGAGLGALPHILDFAKIAVGTLGGGQKTDPAKLGAASASSATGQQLTQQSQAGDLGGLASNLTALAGSDGADALAQIGAEGLKFASFIGSGAHQSYGEMVIDSAGTTALQDLTNHFRDAIAKVTA
ncbi:cutinase family protein [Rhodococcus erythropolis]|uniref:cutinase family protein n=1 Tax=Rhodococcus erythropolis TaxID=1833 RepID=UPI0029499A0A|nr:cutinase family protein [Rhodococcus erythropolis]MDV6277820.1 cutinase family protein [Rhodococcus erythropolis]